jgi:bacillithiol system protein YtxJ
MTSLWKMADTIPSLSDLETLEHTLEQSPRPVLIFKHSPSCGLSAQAYEELLAVLASKPAADIYVIDVLAHRIVSRAIAARFGVRHESPQALLIQNGQLLWSTSHFGVTAQAIRAALSRRLTTN